MTTDSKVPDYRIPLSPPVFKSGLMMSMRLPDRNVLTIDSLELHSRLRGQGIGRSAIDRTIDIFVAGCGLVACKTWPLGFWPLSETRIHLLSLSMAQRRSGAPLRSARSSPTETRWWLAVESVRTTCKAGCDA